MTSKEALKRLIGNKVFISLGRTQGKTQFINDINIIEKDLEILEILKRHIYYSAKSHCIRMGDIYKKTTSFDYEDIKEWLEK